MKTLSLKLPDEVDARISAIARQRRSNKSEVVRNALDAYLAKETTPQKGSALDLAGDLVGSLEGPGDLSHHDEHMRGYGE
jgi:predicted transcriptional regulator